jgi:maltose O-acetyltransferase
MAPLAEKSLLAPLGRRLAAPRSIQGVHLKEFEAWRATARFVNGGTAPMTRIVASVPQTVLREFGAWRLRPRFRLCCAVARLLPANSFSGARTALYRAAGVRIEERVSILGRIHMSGHGDFVRRLTLQRGCVVAPDVTFKLDAEIVVEPDASLGPGVSLITATHVLGFGSRRMSPAVSAKPIRVETGAWVSVGALILPGVTVGAGSVVSAGSVLTQDAPANALVAGNPASVVQELPFGDR